MKNFRLRCAFVAFLAIPPAHGAPTQLVHEQAVGIGQPEPGVFLVDFGRVAFGNLQLEVDAGIDSEVTIHFGESFSQGRVNRRPPGTVRYSAAGVRLAGQVPVIAAPPADKRNTQQGKPGQPPAILTPADWGVLVPFRWVEIEGWPGELRSGQVIRRAAYSSTWNDDAAAFESSDDMLNQIWELSRYSIKATSFAGVYVDGDRERIPYEADAYLNQISHYYSDNDIRMARDTFDHLMMHGTWPTEWAPHMVFMAYADWMQSGDSDWLARRYEPLKAKLLLERAGDDGLIRSDGRQIRKGDIVDWPPGERDGYEFTSVNTVVNAFHLRAMGLMAKLAKALGREADASYFEASIKHSYAAFQEQLFSPGVGLYRDGLDTAHISLHANLFPLAFGLVPEDRRDFLSGWLAERGMACSVYAAQYLLEGLFENGAGTRAIELIAAPSDRSWRHMIESGTTITWEAWDMKYKPNQDWNHAWGAAPANLLPRYVLGAQPHEPGWSIARIRPVTGDLAFANGKVPTPLGPIRIEWRRGEAFSLALNMPEGMSALVDLPAERNSSGVRLNGAPVNAIRSGGRWILEDPVSGSVAIEVH